MINCNDCLHFIIHEQGVGGKDCYHPENTEASRTEFTEYVTVLRHSNDINKDHNCNWFRKKKKQ